MPNNFQRYIKYQSIIFLLNQLMIIALRWKITLMASILKLWYKSVDTKRFLLTSRSSQVLKHTCFCMNTAFHTIGTSVFVVQNLLWYLWLKLLWDDQQCSSPTHWIMTVPVVTAENALLGIIAITRPTAGHPPNEIQMSHCEQTRIDDRNTLVTTQ